MKKVFTLLITGLTCLLVTAREHQKTIPGKENRSLLWKITGREMKKPSYLFGTIHLVCPKDYIWTPAMKKAFMLCDQVCFEMNMDDPSVMMEVAMGMIDEEGKSLKEYFTAEQYDSLEKFVADSLGMNLSLFQQMKPGALQVLFETKAIACDNPVSYETNIMELAKKAKKEIVGLEEPKEQVKLFDAIPPDSIITGLLRFINEYSQEKKEYQKLVDAYKKQDIAALYETILQSESVDLDMFLDERNQKWIGRMEEYMEQKPVFFAVGAGHLWGDNGVINLLRNLGYTVTPVK